MSGAALVVLTTGTALAAPATARRPLRVNAANLYRYWRALRDGRTPERVTIDVGGIRSDAFARVRVGITVDPESETPAAYNYELPDGQVITGRSGLRHRLVLFPDPPVAVPTESAVVEVRFLDADDVVVAAVTDELSSMGDMDDI